MVEVYIIIPYRIYQEGSGIGVLGPFYFLVAIHAWIVYNMLNKEADTIEHTYPFPANILVEK